MDHIHSTIDLAASFSANFQATKEKQHGWQPKGLLDVDYALDISVRQITSGA